MSGILSECVVSPSVKVGADVKSRVRRKVCCYLPSVLHDHVTVVTPSTCFGHPKPHHKTSFVQRIEDVPSGSIGGVTNLATNSANSKNNSAVSPTCNDQITPSCLNALYNISYTPVSTKNNSLGVAGYLNQYANHADLQVRKCQIRVSFQRTQVGFSGRNTGSFR